MSKRINDVDAAKIKVLASTGIYTTQEIVNYFNDAYSTNQIRTFLKNKAPELKDKVRKDTSKGNIKLKSIVHKIFPNVKVLTEHHVGEGLRLDVYIGEPYNLGFEFDGVQHFMYTPGLHKNEEEFQKGQERDRLKEELCDGRGINLIRIRYDEPLTYDYLRDKIIDTNYGTGHIQEGFETGKEKHKTKQDKFKKVHSARRKEAYDKYKKSDAYQAQKDKQSQARRDQYQKRKEWQKTHKK